MQKTEVPIITYHSIDESESVISVRKEAFRAQMNFLYSNNFNIISLKTLGKYLRDNLRIPPKTVALTFDDGFKNFYNTAFPILNQYNFPATVFLVTDYCGKDNTWPGNISTLNANKLMSWKEIKELSKHGIGFAAHSCRHPNLTKIPLVEAVREVTESKLMIENQLGIEVTDFAYPYGVFNSSVRQIAEKNFKSAYSTNLGKVKSGDDLFTLKRVDAYYLQNERIFRSIASVNFDIYLFFRQMMRRLKAECYNNY